MHKITIWAIESNYDRDAVKCLVNKLAKYLDVEANFKVIGKSGYSDVNRKNRKNSVGLERAVEIHLKESKSVIFFLDSDSPIRLKKRMQEKNSAISQIKRLEKRFAGRVYLALAVHELEAWLLIDPVGICCYLVKLKNRQRQQERFGSLIKKVPKNTEQIIEAESGGKGPKEYLIEFSKKILKESNPQIHTGAINKKKYREDKSPELAKYIEINAETLKRNKSLQRFGDYITKCIT